MTMTTTTAPKKVENKLTLTQKLAGKSFQIEREDRFHELARLPPIWSQLSFIINNKNNNSDNQNTADTVHNQHVVHPKECSGHEQLWDETRTLIERMGKTNGRRISNGNVSHLFCSLRPPTTTVLPSHTLLQASILPIRAAAKLDQCRLLVSPFRKIDSDMAEGLVAKHANVWSVMLMGNSVTAPSCHRAFHTETTALLVDLVAVVKIEVFICQELETLQR